MYTLSQTINYSQTFLEYIPLNAGTGWEPAISIATTVRNTILNAPFTWPWNRNEYSIASGSPSTLLAGVQDYTFAITDFAYLEKVSLLDADGKYGYELKDVYNTNILGVPTLETGAQAQPNACAVKYYNPGINVSLRFLSVPEQSYTGIFTYQKLPLPFTYYNLQSISIVSGVVYYNYQSSQAVGANDELAGQFIFVDGFTNPENNGTFLCVSSTLNYMILVNPDAIPEFVSAYAINESWYPVPDSFMDIFNNLFLAEAMAMADDGREQIYRQRGIAALLAKSEGLTEMQRNAFLSQWISRGVIQQTAATLRTQQGTQARGI